MAVRLTDEGLEIDGKLFGLYSGAVQYWRLDPGEWETVLDHVVDLGFGCIEVYLPWGFHETAPGEFDFSGKLDAGRFLDLAHARGLKVIARPGPHTNAEVTGFGYPNWVLRDPDCLARAPGGHPVFVPSPPRMFPMPSYAGDRLYEQCAGYLDAVCEVIRPRLHPDGPVVAVQPDNEMSFFFRTSAFDVDYSLASRADYRRFLEKRYRKIEKLNRAHGREYADFEQVEPPESFEAEKLADLPPYLDWCAYKEAYLRGGVLRVADMLRKRGIEGVLLTHNIPLGSIRSPFDLPALEEEIDLVGIDMYYQRADHRSLEARCLALCGASRFPYAPEFASGAYNAWQPIDFEDQVFTTLAAMMHGLRGINFYMLVDRERWYGAPIRRDGSTDARRCDFFRRVLRLARRRAGTRRLADCLLLTTRLYGRLTSLHNVLDPLSPMAMAGLGLEAPDWCEAIDLGCARPPAASLEALHEGLFDVLGRARLSFDVGEPGRPAGNLSRYKLAVLPTVDLLERRDAERVLGYVQAGGFLVFGPDLPRADEAGRGMHLMARAVEGAGKALSGTGGRRFESGAGALIWLPDLMDRIEAGDLAGLAGELLRAADLAGCKRLPDPGDESLRTAVHVGQGAGWLWIANPTDQDRTARLDLPDAGRLIDHWRNQEYSVDGCVELPMPAWSIRPLEVRP